MAYTSIIIDNFYENPDEVREFALSQEYNVSGNFPGNRTTPFLNESTKEHIASHISPLHGKITWVTEEYTGAFQYTTQDDRSWIHADEHNKWAGVLYLTPNAPLSGGTGIFKHKASGLYKIPRNIDESVNLDITNTLYKDSRDMTKWELVDFIGNKYNRLVIYQGDLFHSSLDYFGTDINSGRLFQTFFFDTEK